MPHDLAFSLSIGIAYLQEGELRNGKTVTDY